MAISLYDRREWRRSLHSGLYLLCAYAGHPLYALRVYHRPSRCVQHLPRLLPALRRQRLEVCGSLGCRYRFSHHGLLCCGVWLVPAVCLCLVLRRAHRQCRLRKPLFCRVLLRPLAPRHLDARDPCHHLSGDCQRCAQRYRAYLQDAHAHALHPAPCHRRGVVPPARWRARHGVPLQARLHQARQRRLPRRPRSVVLLAQHRHGLHLHLCLLLQASDQSVEVGPCRCHCSIR